MRIVDAQLARAVGELNTEHQLSGNELSLVLAQFLRRHRLIRRVSKIHRAIEKYVDAVSGTQSATAFTARSLDDSSQKRIHQVAARLLGKPGREVSLEFREKPALIGGFQLETDDERYDGSVSRVLKELHKSL